jgi:hypothetical protein
MSDDDDIAPLDRDALQRCMDIAKRDREIAAHLQAKLRAGQTWAAVARSAAYSTQITSLRLRPWQDPPCVVDEDDPEERDRQAQMLLRQMLKAGLSRYEPDPRIALLKKKREHERQRAPEI